MSHLKSLAAPKSWAFLRKEQKYVTRAHPGGHAKQYSLPLSLVIKQLGYANTTRETRKLIGANDVRINGSKAKDHRRPAGFMDVVQFGKESFRVVLDTKGRLMLTNAPEANAKIGRITRKTPIKGSKIQITLNDGRNIIVEKDSYKVGDSLHIEFPSTIKEHIPMKEGQLAYLTGGSHVGIQATIEKIDENTVILKQDKHELRTHRRHVFVIGKGKPAITLP